MGAVGESWMQLYFKPFALVKTMLAYKTSLLRPIFLSPPGVQHNTYGFIFIVTSSYTGTTPSSTTAPLLAAVAASGSGLPAFPRPERAPPAGPSRIPPAAAWRSLWPEGNTTSSVSDRFTTCQSVVFLSHSGFLFFLHQVPMGGS